MHPFINGPRTAVATAAAAAAIALCAGASVAQNSEPKTEATYICRPVVANETGDARMMKSGTQLTCRAFAVAMKMSNGTLKVIGNVTARPVAGPNLSKALTTQQINDAWSNWIVDTFQIHGSSPN
jgi:hypothetical protein